MANQWERTGAMAHSIFLCVLLYTALIQASFVDGRYIHKEVEIDVKSSWPGTSYVHEAAEFLVRMGTRSDSCAQPSLTYDDGYGCIAGRS